ncbi:hypothetical protein [Solidesulfovibrio alcoholivorans]|uniref:hypothetical protein n=1 Tax=Solidesulfovibrio alcoholivorans TaxID=81406 RepID=UPI000495F7ED|nr:hypothetical protein [Solidesulfovibrio alcoholivorans]
MGLHDSLLDVPERLRIWQLAGVRYFYLDPEAQTVSSPQPTQVFSAAGESCAPEDPSVSPAAAAAPDAVSDDPASWPAPWPALFAKAPTHPAFVITYAALGEDMTGHADPRRGPLWRKLLVSCGLAGKNAVAFWPMHLPDSDDPQRDQTIFLAGLRLLGPRVLAVFDPAMGDMLKAQRLTDVSLQLLSLPDPDTLLQGDKEVWDHVVASLASP